VTVLRRDVLNLERPPSLMMAPMIDVVFLLLIFFMFTHLTVVTRELDARLPRSAGLFPVAEAQPAPANLVFIELRRHRDAGEIRVNNELAPDLEALYQRLLFIRSSMAGPRVLIDADDEVSVGLVVGVFDTCRRARFEEIDFTPPTGRGTE